MQATTHRILEFLTDPEQLEALYRQDPEAFRDSLDEASEAAKDSIALSVWRARLEYNEPGRGIDKSSMWYAIAIGLAVGGLVRLPAIWLGEEWYYPRFAPSLIIVAIAAYFWAKTPNRRLLLVGLGLSLGAAVYVSLLPGYTDSVVMALIHLPFVFWTLLGVVFTGGEWKDPSSRIRFVRYNGELLVLGSLVVLGGIVLSVITVSLFTMVVAGVEDWYATNIAVVGAAAVPVAGTYLYDAVFNRRTGIATVLARVFAPLFLVMVVAYLAVAFTSGENPFVDRTFLITFNALLVLVLGMSVFSVVERAEGSEVGLADYVNLALIFLTLLINAIALSAVLFRLSSYGFTPNRVTVLGANLVIFSHLCWLFVTYVRSVRQSVGFGAVRRVVAAYLPVYAGWAAVVAFLLPLVFAFG